ncbi:MAG: YceI family protein [Frankia sp.]
MANAEEPAATGSVAPKGSYVIDPAASIVRFATRAMFGLAPVRGTFAVARGAIVVAEPATESTVSAVIDAESFDTKNARRDRHVKSADLLDVAAHPTFDFTSTAVSEEAGRWTVSGDLTAHGVTAPVSIGVDVPAGFVIDQSGAVRFTAHATIDRYAFGVTKVKGMVARRLRVTFEMVAQPA